MAGSIIWLASYPKSGNTWLRLLLANLLADKEEAVDINEIDLPHRSVVDHQSFEDRFLIDTGLLTREEVDELRPMIVEAVAAESKDDIYVKVHDAYRILKDGKPLLGHGHARAALYVIRDPRDVAVSFAHHSGITIERAIEILNDILSGLGGKRKSYAPQVPQILQDWSSHVESWTEQKDVPAHVIRYEDLHNDPISALRKAARFLNLEAPETKVAHAVRCAGFSELQRQEQEADFCERSLKAAGPFFRSGRVGGWREVLTPEQQQSIIQAHQRVMARFHYI
ncbi:MAG: sulfotransferase domain-containing protein [Methylobacter sp.]